MRTNLREELLVLRKCIVTVALSGSLPDKLEAAARAGFDGVEALGTDLVLVCSNTLPAALDDDARAAADLHAMAERAAARGLRVRFEALSWVRHIRPWRHAWKVIQAAGHPALGLVVDSFHTLALQGHELTTTAQIAGSCNAVLKRPDGTLLGDMFDGAGFVRGMQRKGLPPSGARALVVGAGGVGCAIAASLASGGLRSIGLFDRHVPSTKATTRCSRPSTRSCSRPGCG